MAESIVKLKVDDSSFNQRIKEAARSFADFGKRIASAGADSLAQFTKGTMNATSAFKAFNTALKANALVLVSSLAIQAGVALAEMFSDWISGADDAADAQERLNQKLEDTKIAIDQITNEGDFNARLAKAAGASTTDILKMKLETAKQANAQAMETLFDKNIEIGSEEYKKAKEMFDKTQKMLQKATQDLKVDEVARANKTGEYADKGGGGGNNKKNKKDTPIEGSLAYQRQLVSDLTKSWNNASEGVRDDYLVQLVAAEKVLEKMVNNQKLLRENINGKFLGGEVQTDGLGSVTGRQLGVPVTGLSADLLPQLMSPLQQLNTQIQSLTKVMELAATPEQYAQLSAQLEELKKAKDEFTGNGKSTKKEDRDLKKLADKASTFASGLSSIASGLKGIGIDIPKEVDQAINVIQGLCSIIQGVDAAISIFSSTAMAANTAAIIANTAALTSNTATNLIPGLANGGIIKAFSGTLVGNTYSGDQLRGIDQSGQLYGLNAGEVVLNRAQVGNLASQLSGGMAAMQLSAVITGEQLRLVLNNNGRRTGRGEYVTTNFR